RRGRSLRVAMPDLDAVHPRFGGIDIRSVRSVIRAAAATATAAIAIRCVVRTATATRCVIRVTHMLGRVIRAAHMAGRIVGAATTAITDHYGRDHQAEVEGGDPRQ